MELDSQESPGEIKSSREVELDSQESPGEIKRREVELGSHSRMDCLAAEMFLNSCFSGHSLSDLICSAQLLKQQLAKYISCFALAGSHVLDTVVAGGG